MVKTDDFYPIIGNMRHFLQRILIYVSMILGFKGDRAKRRRRHGQVKSIGVGSGKIVEAYIDACN